jgi:hypothetical protein
MTQIRSEGELTAESVSVKLEIILKEWSRVRQEARARRRAGSIGWVREGSGEHESGSGLD